MALDVRIENLNGVLRKEAFMEMFVILHQSKPGFQELVVGFHIHHVVFIKLTEGTKQACRKMGHAFIQAQCFAY